MQTPWGPSQHIEDVAPGIQFVSTTGHGGYLLSPERVAAMPAALKESSHFYPLPMGPEWFEEDCEAARIVVAFPKAFKPGMADTARRMLQSMRPGMIARLEAGRK